MKKFRLLSLIVLYLVSGMSVFAQSGNAQIKGTVIDALTEEPLFGASVAVEGTSLGATTDLNGQFTIYNIPAGTYTLLVRYIGYEDIDSTNIQLKEGETFYINSAMIAGLEVLSEVVVTAMVKGQMAAMNQQRASNSIVDIVASDRIREIPDVNAAESIGRLPGVSLKRSGGEGNKIVVRGLSPEYTIVQIDGVRLTGVDLDRSVGLSGVTSEMLDGIELTKSLTADKDADAIGGVVNLRTRVAEEGFHFDILAQGGYNSLDQKFGNYKFAAGIGNRFFGNKLGVLFNAGLEQVIRSNDTFTASYDAIPTTSLGDSLKTNNATIREQKATRSREFGSLVLDYKTDFMSIKFNNTLNRMTNVNVRRDNEFRFGENDFRFKMSEEKPIEILQTHSLNSSFNIVNTSLDINLSYSNTKLDKPLDRYTFVDDQGLKDEYQSIPEGDKFFASPSYLIDKYYDTPSAYFAYLDNDIRDTTFRRDETKAAEISWKVPYSFSKKISGYLKVGFKYSQKDRSSDRESHESYYHGGLGTNSRNPNVYEQFPDLLKNEDIPGYVANVGIPALNFDDPDYDYGEILNGRYQMGWSADLDRLQEVHNYSLYPIDQIYRRGVESADQDYINQEKLMAGFIMAEINIGRRFMILPGLRYEYMQTEYTANYIWEDPFAQDGLLIGYPDTVSVNDRNNVNWFPSINTKIEVTEWWDIRAAYYKSCSRPNYELLSPGLISNNNRTEITAFNPFLNPSIAHNFDLGFSFYTNKLGLLTVNLFYKDISELVYRIPTYQSQYFDNMVGAPESFIESLQKPRVLYSDDLLLETGSEMKDYPVNNPNKARFRGIEFSWQTNFWYLSNKVLRGFVVNLNFSKIWSETEFPYLEVVTTYSDDFIPQVTNTPYYRTRNGRMLDQPSTLFNGSIGWDYKGFTSRLSIRYQGETIEAIDPIDNLKDEITSEIFGLDLLLKQQITRGLSVTLSIINLTQYIDDSYYSATYSEGQIEMPKNSEFYGLSAQLGIRYKL